MGRHFNMTSSELKTAARHALKENFIQKLLLLIVPLLLSFISNRVTQSYSNNINHNVQTSVSGVSNSTDAVAAIDWGLVLYTIIPVVVIVLLISFFISIIITVFQTAAMFNYLDIFRGEKEEINLSTDIFRAFKEGYFWKIAGLSFVISIIMFILLFIPIIGWGLMIYLGLSWSQATYVLYDKLKNDDYHGIWDVLAASKALMVGYKFRYFLFNLTFIGWYFLDIISIGISRIWTLPFITMSMVSFYEARIQDRL